MVQVIAIFIRKIILKITLEILDQNLFIYPKPQKLEIINTRHIIRHCWITGGINIC